MNKGYSILDIQTKERWKVVFKDEGKWLLGVYVPENLKMEDIKFLERHDAPELFILVKGKMILVVADGNNLEEIEMKHNIPYIVTGWHNAYRPKGTEGVALVIERDGVKTEYRNIREFIPKA